jgi:hypothetical protein
MTGNVALKLRFVKRKMKAKIEAREIRNRRPCCAVLSFASLLKDVRREGTSFNNSIALQTLWETLSSQSLTVFILFWG